MEPCPECYGTGEVQDGDGELEECAWCGGSGTIEPPDTVVAEWEADVDRGIQAHRERALDW